MDPRLLEIANYLKSKPLESSGEIYHPIPFPEFSELNTSSDQRSAYKKWDMIYTFLGSPSDLSKVKILDIGANVGFYAFNFAKLGANVDAYEPNESYANLGKAITKITKLSVHWSVKPVEHTDIEGKEYDIALMLSVFQWISHGNKYLRQASELLSVISNSSKIVFFELGCNNGKSAIQTEEKPIKWIWGLLEEKTAPKRVAYLGKLKSWKRGERYLFACSDDEFDNFTLQQRLMNYRLSHHWI